MEDAMIFLINTDSGSIRDGMSDEADRLFAELGVTAEIVSVRSENLLSTVESLVSSAPSEIAVLGGDGTAACVLNHCAGHNITVLPLPGGTMNMLHKSLHGEFDDWQDCFRRAHRSGTPRSIPRGSVGGHTFYVGITLGQLSRLSSAREMLRHGKLLEAAGDLLESEALDIDEALEVSFECENGSPHNLHGANVGALLDCDEGDDAYRFDLGILHAVTHGELAKTAVAALFNDWRDVDDIDYFRTPTFRVIDHKNEGIAATLDGELVELPSSITVKIEHDAVKVRSAK